MMNVDYAFSVADATLYLDYGQMESNRHHEIPRFTSECEAENHLSFFEQKPMPQFSHEDMDISKEHFSAKVKAGR